MKHHIVWAILAVVTFAGHMIAGLYAEFIYFLAEYIWFVSVAISVLAVYAGITTAARADSDKRGKAIASALIGAIVLLGLLISASSWLFMLPESGFGTLASLG